MYIHFWLSCTITLTFSPIHRLQIWQSLSATHKVPQQTPITNLQDIHFFFYVRVKLTPRMTKFRNYFFIYNKHWPIEKNFSLSWSCFLVWNNAINRIVSLRSYHYLHCLGLRPVPCAELPMTWLKSFGILSLSLISFSAFNRASRSNILLSSEVLDILYKPAHTAHNNWTEL